MAMPETVWIVVCSTGFTPAGGYPSDCKYEPINSSILYPDATAWGLSKDQYDEFFGAVIGIVVLVIIFALIKKAIEQ